MHTSHRPLPARVGVVAAAIALAFAAGSAKGQVRVDVTNLVSNDQSAHSAQITDPGLVNAWGMSYSPAGSPFWVSANGTGMAELYSVNPTTQVTVKQGLTVTLPDIAVTGQVFNSAAATGAFNGDNFLFVSEGGTISGWRGGLGTAAEVLQTGIAANVYKGAAFATLAGTSYLYAANFRSGAIDVLKGNSGLDLTGNFTDPNLPAGYAPFNVQNLGGTIYVTYAVQDATKHDEVAGAGLGIVDSYNLQGNLIARVAAGGPLDAPWGLAIAPSSFGALAGALLVGNFGDGRISAFDVASHGFLGQLAASDGTPLAIDGLWAIAPGNDGSAGSSARLYFTAGPDGESNGLFGVLTPVPEPSSALLLLAGLGGIAMLVRRRGAARRR
ncbi:MAG TPA: TIGR03118 family protein [Caldimonas sp.]|jgi:uncharacterized protein (TIGR03118 family)|nr:TIGR03118 family protein [Caldimonas sp.]HEX4234069.1 TIGR03118 family protein [Caldimonas sp.]